MEGAYMLGHMYTWFASANFEHVPVPHPLLYFILSWCVCTRIYIHIITEFPNYTFFA